MPIPIDEEPDVVGADIASKPVTPPALMIGARRNFLYISHNTKPTTAYLVVVGKKPRLDNLPGGGGGNKNYHVQKGGALPETLPEGSEIFPINVDNPNFLDIMVSLLPPNELLKVSDDGTKENSIITEIRKSGRRPKGDLNALYGDIKGNLITDENQNPLTIGLRAVYYQNIIKLIRLLDNTLNPTFHVHEEMYKKLRKFMDFTYGTFGVLEALFDATFKHNLTSPRPNTPQDPPPKIDAVFNKEQIKQIVGWKRNKRNKRNTNKHFDMLFDKFSIMCPPPNGKKNTFLTDDTATQENLGSKKTSYNQFRLNWIILLAFHTLYMGNTKSKTVGELIKALYDAFLGWMATTPHKDTFGRMFSNGLVTPDETYSTEVKKRINEINGDDPTLQPLVKAIKDKLCELQSNPVNPVNHEGEYDDDANDPDYVPPPQGYKSDSSSENPGDVAEMREELGLLSPGFSHDDADDADDADGRTRAGRRNQKSTKPVLHRDGSDVEDNLPPPQPKLSEEYVTDNDTLFDVYMGNASAGGVKNNWGSDSESDSVEFIGDPAKLGNALRDSLDPHTARSISGKGKKVWEEYDSPSRTNRPTMPSSQPQQSLTPSPPQNDHGKVFIRRESSPVVPELDFDKVPTFDTKQSKQLLVRLPQDARPSTARDTKSKKIQPSGSLSARPATVVSERPAAVAPDHMNKFKGDPIFGNSSSSSKRSTEVKPVPVAPSSQRNPEIVSPRQTLKHKSLSLHAHKDMQGGNRKYTRKRNDKKVYDKPKKTRRRNIQPVSSNKNKHTRKRSRT